MSHFMTDGEPCGHWMPRVGESCGRPKGHKGSHYSRATRERQMAGLRKAHARERERYANDPEYRERERIRRRRPDRERKRQRYANEPEYRARQAESRRKNYVKHRESRIAYRKRPENRARANARVRWRRANDPAYREKENNRTRERYASDAEYRERRSKYNQEYSRTRYANDPMYRRRISLLGDIRRYKRRMEG